MLEDKYARQPATWLKSRADNPAFTVLFNYGEGLPNVREQRMGAVFKQYGRLQRFGDIL